MVKPPQTQDLLVILYFHWCMFYSHDYISMICFYNVSSGWFERRHDSSGHLELWLAASADPGTALERAH